MLVVEAREVDAQCARCARQRVLRGLGRVIGDVGSGALAVPGATASRLVVLGALAGAPAGSERYLVRVGDGTDLEPGPLGLFCNLSEEAPGLVAWLTVRSPLHYRLALAIRRRPAPPDHWEPRSS